MALTTYTLKERLVKCERCGFRVPPNQRYCAQCGRPVLSPPMSVIEREPASERRGRTACDPGLSVILQVLPSGTCLTLGLDEPVILGRGGETETPGLLDLSDYNALWHGVSRHHCLLRRRDARLVVTDLGSANGTFLNGELISPHHEYVVARGDKLILGTLHLIVSFD
ncbi:MAG: FHA domain-containing protein [Anaerolineae bacterium]|nr:FHA domain-containing protein [Anaerolineae bacterium]